MRKLYSWNGKIYGGLMDGDSQALYYRKDIFAKQDIRDKFKGNYSRPFSVVTLGWGAGYLRG